MARFPLAVSIQNRGDDTSKDARIVNCFAEVLGDSATGQRLRAVKRPGLDSAFTVATGTGQLLYTWNIAGNSGEGSQVLVAITGDTINTSPTKIAKQLFFTTQPS